MKVGLPLGKSWLRHCLHKRAGRPAELSSRPALEVFRDGVPLAAITAVAAAAAAAAESVGCRKVRGLWSNRLDNTHILSRAGEMIPEVGGD